MSLRIDYSVRERLFRRSGGTLGLCFQCGSCTAVCPLSTESTGYIRRIMKYAQYGVVPSDEKIIDMVLRCTTCGMCMSSCPRGVDIPSVIRALREILSERRVQDQRIVETLWRIYESGNPWGYGSSDIKKFRLSMRDLHASLGQGERPDYVIYSCCSSVIDPLAQRILRSVAGILKRLGYRVSLLDPMCCGDVIFEAGETAFLEEYVQKVADIINRLEAPVITTSPHTYYMLKRVYPEVGVKIGVEILHHTQVLSGLVSGGKLRLRPLESQTVVTYHDPCYLARYMRVIEEPRTLIENIPGVRYVEMEHSREDTMCCGAGGGRIFSEERGPRMAAARLREAGETGAVIMTTACQFCVRMFSDEMKILKTPLQQVVDVSELVLSRME